MSDKLKSIADRIREAKLSISGDKAEVPNGERKNESVNNVRKEDNGKWQKTNESEKPEGKPVIGLIDEIKSLELDETDGTYVHLRISAQMHSKLMALKLAKISTQKLGAFALVQLLDHPEIKQTIKKILNDLE